VLSFTISNIGFARTSKQAVLRRVSICDFIYYK
jgi:hypothetical protein